ncbi:MAG: hypothetical protein RIQ53_2983 [Pseudomonadota bacterium]|jgi:phosphoribosylformimino-5-aminoimidazole carboxamide ribotide isomerase
MRVIPVVDLQSGRVVHARRGMRQAYAPVRSALCHQPDPVQVVQQLCRHAGAPCVYAADLDALAGLPVQTAVLRALYAAVPGLQLWLDAGWTDGAAARSLAAALGVPLGMPLGMPAGMTPTHQPGGLPHATAGLPAGGVLRPAADVSPRPLPGPVLCPVFGSESLREAAVLDTLPPQALLSLDRRDGRAMDPAGVWARPAQWPSQLIVMTLERVGADLGPDLDTLAAVRAAAGPQRRLIGAGGVRGLDDLRAATAAGASAWLVASAFHDGRLPPGLGLGLPP